jgi:hypothetical protein
MEQNPLGNSHGNHSRVWRRLMEHINEGRVIDENRRFGEQEFMAVEEANTRNELANRIEETSQRANRRRALPINDARIAEGRRAADEAMQTASMATALHQLQTTRVRIPEDVIRDKILSYIR